MNTITPQEVVRNAIVYARKRRDEANNDLKAKSLTRPRLIDKVILYIHAVI